MRRILIISGLVAHIAATWQTSMHCHLEVTRNDEIETFATKYNPNMNYISIEWTVGNRVQLTMRLPTGQNPPCASILRKLNEISSVQRRPKSLGWNRDSAIQNLGMVSQGSKICAEFPPVLAVDRRLLEVDCYSGGLGDSVIRFYSRNHEPQWYCLDRLNITWLRAICREFIDFSEPLIKAVESDIAHEAAQRDLSDYLIRNKVYSMRAFIASAKGEESSDEEEW